MPIIKMVLYTYTPIKLVASRLEVYNLKVLKTYAICLHATEFDTLGMIIQIILYFLYCPYKVQDYRHENLVQELSVVVFLFKS